MRKKIKAIVFCIIVGLILFCTLNENAVTTPQVRFWAFLHLLLHGFIILQNHDKFKYQYSPFVLFMGLLNFITWGISPFFVSIEDFQLGSLNIDALQLSFWGYLLFYFVLYRIEASRLAKYNKMVSGPPVKLNWFTEKEKAHFKRLKLVFLASYIIMSFVTLPINGLDSLIIYYTCGLFLVGFYSGLNSFFHNLIFIFILLLESYNAVSSGLIFPLIFLSIFLFVLVLNNYRANAKNLAFTLIFGGSVLAFSVIFSSIKTSYRAQNSDEYGVVERLNLVRDLIEEDKQDNDDVDFVEKTKTGPIWRLSYPVSAFSMVITKTPAEVPYWDGESYTPLIYKWIPRFVWPDKPSEQMGQLFGHRYKVIREDDLYTSMNTPIIAEAYMNFSIFGVYAVMVLMAFVIGSVYFTSNLKQNLQGSRLLNLLNVMKIAYLTTLYVQWESNLSLMLGKILILYFTDLALRKYLIQEKTLVVTA